MLVFEPHLMRFKFLYQINFLVLLFQVHRHVYLTRETPYKQQNMLPTLYGLIFTQFTDYLEIFQGHQFYYLAQSIFIYICIYFSNLAHISILIFLMPCISFNVIFVNFCQDEGILIYYMKILILFLVLLYLAYADRRIVSRPIFSTYNQYGKADSLIIQWMSTQPIYDNDFIKVKLPQIIHDTSLIISFSLSTAHSQGILSKQNSLSYVGNNEYYLPIRAIINPNIWYELKLFLGKSLTLIYGLVQIEIVGRSSLPLTSYSWNNGFQYYHLEQQNIPSMSTFSININNTATLNRRAAERYLVLFEISSTVQVNQPVNVTLQFVDFNASTVNLTIDTPLSGANKGFIFVGSCYARCDYGDLYHSCIHSNLCQLKTSSITITLPYMKINELYLIEAYVINPPYVSSVGIQAYWKDNSGRTAGLAFADDFFIVDPIRIQPQQIRLLWDIPYNTVTTQMDLGLFINDPLSKHQSLSTFDIGFSVSQVTPIQGQYQVKIYVGAHSVLQSSINHNLPSLLRTTKITCQYIYPEIVCIGVDAFINKNFRYYVRGRGFFLTNDTLVSFGNVVISPISQPGFLFTNLIRGLAVKTILNSDYHDYGGLHEGTSTFRIGQSMIVSHNDTMLPNSTKKSIQDFLYSSESLVGIDPSVSPQQLLFFMKVNLNQMSNPIPSNFTQNYTMKVFYNTNIMNTSNLGIDFTAYSSTLQDWDVAHASCYIDSSNTPTMQRYICQKYDDHVYGTQIDNTLTKTNKYGLYRTVCGSGTVSVCPYADCSTHCQIFKGGFSSTAMLTGNAGVLSIRNVTFLKSYHSPVEANQKNLDFVIAFYHSNLLVSATVINGYTVNRTRLQNVKAQLINYYHDNTLTNIGNKIPTLLKVSGHLTLQQAGLKLIKTIRIYLPSLINIKNFAESSNGNTYGCSTKNCFASLGGLNKTIDTWNTQNVIEVKSFSSLTQKFQILFPVVYGSRQNFLQITISFIQFDGQIAGIFRLNGSSSTQNLKGNLNYIALPWTPANNWISTQTQWVNQPSLYRFKQSLDLSLIVHFAPQNFINMGSTLMPPNDTFPSTTFTSSYFNIFSNFTYPMVDGSTKCVDPFAYTFSNTYKIWVLWCPIQPGSLNQIKINYPLYPSQFGSNFPYGMVFTYCYSNTAGNMIGYRIQQNNSNASAQVCSTQKSTTYDKNSVNPQQNVYTTSFNPFYLYPTYKNKFLFILSLPIEAPMNVISCRADQPTQSINFICNIYSQASNVFKFQIFYQGLVDLTIYSIRIYVKSVKNGISTLTTIKQYNVSIILPFTDPNTNQPSFSGTSYTPYDSVVATCSNSFTYSSVSSQQYIYLSDPVLNAVSSAYYGTLSFKASFSNSRTTFFDTSELLITFSEAVLNSYSRCQLYPNTHFFSKSIVDGTGKIMTLTPSRNILDFTQNQYQVVCTKIITTGNNISATMLWKDGSNNIQTTFTSIVFPHTGVNSIVSSTSCTISSKLYNSPGYLGQYTFNINLATTASDKIGLYIDFGTLHVHQNFVQAQYLKGTSWTQILVFSQIYDIQSKVYLQFIAASSTTIQIRIYGIHQSKQIVSTIRALIKKTNMVTGAISYHSTSVLDSSTVDIVSNPIQIYAFNVNSSSVFSINYSFPITYNSGFFIRFDQLFTMSKTDFYQCQINLTVVPCSRLRPDLLYVNNNVSHLAKISATLYIKTLTYFYNEKYDPQQVHFSMFIADATRATILYGSHQHLENQLLSSSLLPPQSLIWNIPKNIFNSKCQIVFIGYYGVPAKLSVSSKAYFNQSFSFNYTDSVIFSILDMKGQLGTLQDINYIGTLNTSALGFRNLIFSHNSSYSSLPSLPIYVSSQKCSLKTQFSQYNIVSGGVTIPIAINVSLCRPMDLMTISTSINTPFISSDPQLSTKTITSASEIIYIVLNHQAVTTTIGQSFQLKITLNSTNPTVQNSYNIIPNVTIKVVDKSVLIGNPQAKQPVVYQITQNLIDFRLQCNTPATIYWGVGLYPTMLGITVQQIGARLIEKSNGLVRESIDIFSWSNQKYGLAYVNDFNIEKNLTVDGLEGGLNYVFKYYCVDQTGKASGGKITNFNTQPSNFALMKITLGFSNILNYQQVNLISCSVSQQLIIPYNQTISSVHSNCINNTQVYYKNNQYFYDEKITSDNPFNYFFYVDTAKVSARNITSRLVSNLGKNKLFMNGILPYFGSIRSDTLYNNYEPTIYDMQLQISRTSFKITVNVGLVNTYLIAAIMDKHFDPVKMSLPTHYLMKQGYFSQGTKFDQIFSIYGRQNISVTFQNLNEGQKVSVFYFTTVDNSALNSRNSKVLYKDLILNVNQFIDLGQKYVVISALLAIVALIISY